MLVGEWVRVRLPLLESFVGIVDEVDGDIVFVRAEKDGSRWRVPVEFCRRVERRWVEV